MPAPFFYRVLDFQVDVWETLERLLDFGGRGWDHL